jgi:hypothetical protein
MRSGVARDLGEIRGAAESERAAGAEERERAAVAARAAMRRGEEMRREMGAKETKMIRSRYGLGSRASFHPFLYRTPVLGTLPLPVAANVPTPASTSPNPTHF